MGTWTLIGVERCPECQMTLTTWEFADGSKRVEPNLIGGCDCLSSCSHPHARLLSIVTDYAMDPRD